MDFTNKIILITGAGRGIGNMFAHELAKKGARLILLDIDQTMLDVLRKDFDGHAVYQVDLASSDEIHQFVKEISDNYEHLDILINNAGVGIYRPIEELTQAEWDLSYGVNVHAPFLLTKLCIPLFEKSEHGVVVNMGSKCGIEPKSDRSAYCSTKFALRGWSLSMSEEFSDTSIDVMLVTLGSTMTGFGPLSLEAKEQLKEGGKCYYAPQEVVEKVLHVIEIDEIISELELIQPA